MKKLLCVLLSLLMLLSFAACSEEKKEEETANDKAQIEELLINKHKELMRVATKEEVRGLRSEAYWEKHPLDEYYDRVSASFRLIEGSEKSGEEVLKEKVGDNYKFSVEIKELTFYDNKEELAKAEEMMEDTYYYELDGIEQYCTVTCVVRVQGDKDVLEWEYNGADGSTLVYLYKIDGKWCWY